MRAPFVGESVFPIAGINHIATKQSTDIRGTNTRIAAPNWTPACVYVVHNNYEHTLRGLHFQRPFMRKVVACTSGVIFDVLVDLREESKTYLQWTEIVLSQGDAIEVPAGIAHGYMTITPHASMTYLLESDYPDDLGLRWDDPKIGIAWPGRPTVMSERDRAWELLP